MADLKAFAEHDGTGGGTCRKKEQARIGDFADKVS